MNKVVCKCTYCAEYNACYVNEKLGHKIEVLEQELEKLKYNYEIRTKEYNDFKASLPETHWGYWRERAGMMTSEWYDRGVKIEVLEKQNKILSGLLKNRTTHECYSWDGLTIDYTSPEFECCECAFSRAITDTIKSLKEIEGLSE